MLTGSRGVGKTVLLGEAAAHAAERYSWLTCRARSAGGEVVRFSVPGMAVWVQSEASAPGGL